MASYRHSTATLEVTQARPSGLSEEPTEMADLEQTSTRHHDAQFDNPVSIETQGNWVSHSTRTLAGTPILIMIHKYSQESRQISRGNRQPTCENPSTIAIHAFRSSLSALGVGQ